MVLTNTDRINKILESEELILEDEEEWKIQRKVVRMRQFLISTNWDKVKSDEELCIAINIKI